MHEKIRVGDNSFGIYVI